MHPTNHDSQFAQQCSHVSSVDYPSPHDKSPVVVDTLAELYKLTMLHDVCCCKCGSADVMALTPCTALLLVVVVFILHTAVHVEMYRAAQDTVSDHARMDIFNLNLSEVESDSHLQRLLRQIPRKADPDRQHLPRMYLAHHELKGSDVTTSITIC